MDWTYLTFKNGRLLDDDGCDMNSSLPSFASESDAESYLINEGIRATIR